MTAFQCDHSITMTANLAKDLLDARAEIARLTSDVCIHSSVRDDCLSCQHGALLRCDAELAHLRVVVEAPRVDHGLECACAGDDCLLRAALAALDALNEKPS
jgi:hypothetical protein